MTALLLTLSLALPDPQAVCEPGSGALLVTFGETTVVASREGFSARARTTSCAQDEETAEAGWIALGETASGRPYRLSIAEAWRLNVGTAQAALEPPPMLRNAERLRILGSGGGRVWLGGVGVLGLVEVATGRIDAARLDRRRASPLPITMGHSADIVVGRDVLRCETPSTCVTLGRLAGPVTAVVADDSGTLLAVSGGKGGLYRAAPGRIDETTLLVAGTVEVLCEEGTGDAWALVRDGSEARVVAAATATPALRLLDPREVLVQGVIEPEERDVQTAKRVLELAVKNGWPELERLALELGDDARPVVRRAAAAALGGLHSARATAALWLLGHDADPDVRLDALYASIRRCNEDASLTCTQVLGSFVTDNATDVAWTARDVMLEENPRAALYHAPSAYKLDAIAGLVARLQREGAVSALRALELLAADRDPKVRDAARMALVGNLP